MRSDWIMCVCVCGCGHGFVCVFGGCQCFQTAGITVKQLNFIFLWNLSWHAEEMQCFVWSSSHQRVCFEFCANCACLLLHLSSSRRWFYMCKGWGNLNSRTRALWWARLAGLSVGVFCAGTAALRLGHSPKERLNTLPSLVAAVTRTAHVRVCLKQK